MNIDEIKKLKKGWNGEDAVQPNKVSIKNAESVIEALETVGVFVGYIQPSESGGVLLIYIGDIKSDVRDQKWCKIECDNDGDIGILFSDGKVLFILREFITMKECIDRIKQWLLE